MLIDTHAHIDMDCYEDDYSGVISRAKENGVEKIIIPAVEPKDFNKIIQFTHDYDNIYCALGLHPSEAQKYYPKMIDEIEDYVKHNKKIVAIGEVGLDYYWDKSFVEQQKAVFKEQIELAKKLSLPILIHDREAHQDTFDVLKSSNINDLPIVMHCYSGSWEFAKEFLKMNCYIALGGVVTFKNAQKVKEVAQNIPLDRLLLETDCPYMTPVPHRGQQNEPAYVKFVAQEIANLRNVTFEEIAIKTTENANKLFQLN